MNKSDMLYLSFVVNKLAIEQSIYICNGNKDILGQITQIWAR